MERRALLKRMLMGALPVMFPRWLRVRLVIPGRTNVSASEELQLRALAGVVLPASLGRSRTESIADHFVKWIRDYKAGADLGYGYGITHPRKAPPNPAAHYPEQLAQLEAAARAKGGTFAKLNPAVQEQLVADALASAKIETVPRRPNGRHVAADLMSFFFYVDPDGEDFLYKAAIERENCRGLGDSGKRPASLT